MKTYHESLKILNQILSLDHPVVETEEGKLKNGMFRIKIQNKSPNPLKCFGFEVCEENQTIANKQMDYIIKEYIACLRVQAIRTLEILSRGF